MSHPDDVRSDIQFSISLVNKPGMLARVCQHLADSRINILAMSMMDSSEHGVLRLVVENPDRARQALTALGLPQTETTVLLATLPNRPGALADVVERLARAHISVQYAYCTAGAPGGRSLGIFKVSNVSRAAAVLAERKPHRRETPVRTETRGRRV